ncbi:MAG TPA: hypothetical protein DIU20_14115 [Cryomorphaceae bacterium]|nr:hypothetical protein [Cryomorphaceae bacterium]
MLFTIIAGFHPTKVIGQSYKQRLEEGRGDKDIMSAGLGNYASSTHSLQVYKQRLREGKTDKKIMSSGLGNYASSKYSL